MHMEHLELQLGNMYSQPQQSVILITEGMVLPEAWSHNHSTHTQHSKGQWLLHEDTPAHGHHMHASIKE